MPEPIGFQSPQTCWKVPVYSLQFSSRKACGPPLFGVRQMLSIPVNIAPPTTGSVMSGT